jgi:hypothetical protein
MSTEKKPDATPVAHVNEKLFAGMAMDPQASKEMQTAKAVAILHAAIRRLPEQQSPGRCQQETTHRYI